MQTKWQNVVLPYFPAHNTHFFPEKCDLNLTCILCAKGKYYFHFIWRKWRIEWKQPWRWF